MQVNPPLLNLKQMNPEASKSATSLWTSLEIRSHHFDRFFRVIGSVKMKFALVLAQRKANISNILRLTFSALFAKTEN